MTIWDPTTGVIWGILIYVVGMIAIGFWASGQIHNLPDFLVAGRKLPFYLATATLFATWFGGGTVMGGSAEAYSSGLIGVIADPFAAGIALIIAGLFYVVLLRRMELLTITDVFGRYYGKGAEIFSSTLMVPVYIGWLGAQLLAVGYIMEALTGWDRTWMVIAGTFVIWLYTFAGGMWAVAVTDLFQLILLIGGLLLIFPVALAQIGGWHGLMEVTPPEVWRLLPEHGASGSDWVVYAGQWLMMGLGTVVGQDLIQRSLSSKTERVARWSAIASGIGYLTIGMIPVLLGIIGRYVYPGLKDPEMIIPLLAREHLHPILLVFFIGALLAAIMSSADSALLAGTSLITKNIVQPIWPRLEDKNLLKIARVTTLFFMLVSMGLALKMKSIYSLMVNSWATLFVAILVPVTAALYLKNVTKKAAWVSMLAGVGSWFIYIFIYSGGLVDVNDAVFYAAATIGGAFSLISFLLVWYIETQVRGRVQ